MALFCTYKTYAMSVALASFSPFCSLFFLLSSLSLSRRNRKWCIRKSIHLFFSVFFFAIPIHSAYQMEMANTGSKSKERQKAKWKIDGGREARAGICHRCYGAQLNLFEWIFSIFGNLSKKKLSNSLMPAQAKPYFARRLKCLCVHSECEELKSSSLCATLIQNILLSLLWSFWIWRVCVRVCARVRVQFRIASNAIK